MPRKLSTAVFEAIQKLDNVDAFIWLYEVEVPTSPPTRLRFAGRHPEAITFRGNLYYPFPITHSPVAENTEGDLSTTSLTVSNISREIATILEAHDGLAGQAVRTMLVSAFDLASGNPMIEQDYTIRELSMNGMSITAQLAVYNVYRSRFPALRLMRGHCRFGYRSPGCGYAVPVSSGGLSLCDKTYDGLNGCIAHGANEVTNGYDELHPARFGGFRGIPRQPAGGGL